LNISCFEINKSKSFLSKVESVLPRNQWSFAHKSFKEAKTTPDVYPCTQNGIKKKREMEKSTFPKPPVKCLLVPTLPPTFPLSFNSKPQLVLRIRSEKREGVPSIIIKHMYYINSVKRGFLLSKIQGRYSGSCRGFPIVQGGSRGKGGNTRKTTPLRRNEPSPVGQTWAERKGSQRQ